MHSRLLLLLSFLLVIPTAAWAGFLGRPAETSTNSSTLIGSEIPSPPPAGLPGIAGRASPRATDYILGFTPAPFDPEAGGGSGSEEPSTPGDTVPEPSAALLMLLGLVGLAIKRHPAA